MIDKGGGGLFKFFVVAFAVVSLILSACNRPDTRMSESERMDREKESYTPGNNIDQNDKDQLTRASYAGPVTDLSELLNSGNVDQTRGMIGRRVELRDTKVLGVLSNERAFWIGPTFDKRILVVLDNADASGNRTSHTDSEQGRLNIISGQSADISGVIEMLPNADVAKDQWKLDEKTAQDLKTKEAIYIKADRIAVDGKMVPEAGS